MPEGPFLINGNYALTSRALITNLVNNLRIEKPDFGLIRSLVDKVNIAQIQVVAETRCLQSFNESIYTDTNKRSYDIEADWSITNFLAIRSIHVDGWPVRSLTNGYDDLDYKYNTTSSVMSGYYYESGIIYFEPIPADIYAVKLRYVRKPGLINWGDDTVLDVKSEYVPAILAYAESLCYPQGSPDFARCIAAYNEHLNTLRYLESLKSLS